MATDAPDIDPIHNEGGASGAGWSEIAAYLRCPKEYQLAKVRGIIKPTAATPDYFAVGSMVHAGRAAWLSRKQAMDSETDAFVASEMARVRQEYEDKNQPVSEKAVTDAARIINEYRDHYSMRIAPRTVAVEHFIGPFTLDDADGPEQARTGRLDDFGFYEEFGGRLAIGECKTTSGTPAQVMREYELHGQPALYDLLWNRAPQGAAQYGPIAGIVFDVIQKGYGGKKCVFARIPIEVPERVKEWQRQELRAAIAQAKALQADSPARRNITACTRASGNGRVKCTFHALCMYGGAARGEYAHADGSPLVEGDWD